MYWLVLVTGVLCCSGREDQRVCGFEVLRGGRDRKRQRVGGGDQQQRESDRPDVSKPAGVDEKVENKNWDLLPLIRCECMCVPGAQESSTLTTWG